MSEVISVIVPVYNVEKYIENMLESLCGQSYKNLEILLIDDGSNDKSGEICDKWSGKDNRIRTIHQQNAGVSAARNCGLELASGKYVMFLDADDWIEANMLEVMYKQAETQNADVAICQLVEEKPEEKVYLNVGEKQNEYSIEVFENQIDSGIALLRIWGPVCKLYRRNLLQGKKFEDYKVAEDLLFNTNVICSENFRRVVAVNHPFYHYIIYPGSAMKQSFQKKYLDAINVEEQCYHKLTALSARFSDINLVGCSVSRVFEKYAQLSRAEKKEYKAEFVYCKKYAKEHKQILLGTRNIHRKISGALKVYIPDIYVWILGKRYR